MGFPIRKSTGQSLFAAHRSLSQRTTSFIASCRQGIHRMLLGHLIALISNAHLRELADARALEARARILLLLGVVNIALRKTSLHRDRPSKSFAVSRLEIQCALWNRSVVGSTASRLFHARTTRTSVRRLGHIPSSRLQENRRSASGGTETLRRWTLSRSRPLLEGLVEPDGIEPTTSCLQSRRSPN